MLTKLSLESIMESAVPLQLRLHDVLPRSQASSIWKRPMKSAVGLKVPPLFTPAIASILYARLRSKFQKSDVESAVKIALSLLDIKHHIPRYLISS